MRNRIKAYVEYVLKNKKIENKAELNEEISSNIYERYQELNEKYQDEEKAYLEAINQIGDFGFIEEDVDPKYSIKQSMLNTLLTTSLVLAIGSLIGLLINVLIGFLIVLASITLFITSAHQIYYKAKYNIDVLKNVTVHNELLKSVYVILKPIFIFWNIGISYILAALISSLLTIIIAINTTPHPLAIIVIKAIVFVLLAVIFYFIFKEIYQRIETKYYELIKEEQAFKEEKTKKMSIVDYLKVTLKVLKTIGLIILRLIPLLMTAIIFIVFSDSEAIYFGYGNASAVDYFYLSDVKIFGIIALILLVVSVILAIVYAIKNKMIYLVFIAIITVAVFIITNVFYHQKLISDPAIQTVFSIIKLPTLLYLAIIIVVGLLNKMLKRIKK